ncbi:unnamed protein product [Schistocephalus solidus]|uniref:CNNM transmembrane domain-containing protein n=1 Tax=Schistocephalus solidus TaxID=70667 RepID=A0A183SFQ7_SCHSO|nr:unnamed protein product [Schistocephalus solidus]
MKSHDFLKFCQAFLSIFVVEVFSVAQITSFSIISEYAADRDTLKFAADHPVKIYFFGNNLEAIVVTNSGTGIMMSVFSLPSDNCPHGFNISGPLAWVLYGFMLTQSALFSGLNLGIMTLDVLTLKIMQQAGSPSEKKMADSVLPVRARGNLILCSLTMANVVVNVIISMLSDRLIGGTGWAIFYASIGILIFGEIIPQAICNRYSLLVASKTIPFTKFILYLTLPVAYPLSLVLDTILGEDMGKTFTRAKLAELIKQHVALSMNHRTVKEIMTPIDDVYMLSSKAVLDFETTNDIIAHGFTRIPIFENDRRRVKSVLNVKDLAFVDPNDKIPVSTICNFYKRTFITVPASKTLTEIFDEFRKGMKFCPSHCFIGCNTINY